MTAPSKIPFVMILSLVVSLHGYTASANNNHPFAHDELADSAFDAGLELEYESLSAEEKLAIRWERILETRYTKIPPFARLGLGLLKLLSPGHLEKAFTHNGDTMPKRTKVVHPSGSTILLDWEAVPNHPYTGIFATGSQTVLACMSLATAPETHKIIPGMALKIFIDGKESVNIMALFSLDGQEQFNNFANGYSTKLAPPKDTFANYLVSLAFKHALHNLGDKAHLLF